MTSREMLVFRAGGTSWVIPLEDVAEIVESAALIRLPLLPDSAPGIIDLRGSAVPALSLTERARESGAQVAAILSARAERRIALLVDAIDDIVREEPSGAAFVDFDALVARLETAGPR